MTSIPRVPTKGFGWHSQPIGLFVGIPSQQHLADFGGMGSNFRDPSRPAGLFGAPPYLQCRNDRLNRSTDQVWHKTMAGGRPSLYKKLLLAAPASSNHQERPVRAQQSSFLETCWRILVATFEVLQAIWDVHGGMMIDALTNHFPNTEQ